MLKPLRNGLHRLFLSFEPIDFPNPMSPLFLRLQMSNPHGTPKHVHHTQKQTKNVPTPTDNDIIWIFLQIR